MFGTFLEQTRAVKDPGWNRWANGDDFVSGGSRKEHVTTDRALQLLAVYGSVSFIADLIGQLPVDQFRKNGAIRTEVTPRAPWLDRPNPELDGQDYITQFIAALLTAGMNYDIVLRDSFGRVGELWPQHPNDVIPHRDKPGAPIEWYIHGQRFRGEIRYTRGFSMPGQFVGCNPIGYARQAISAGLNAQEYGESFYEHASIPSVVVSVPGGPETVDAESMSRQFERLHRGPSNAHKVAVITGGGDIKPLTISPADAQFLEGRNYTVTEIATQLYRIPPDLQGAAINGSSLTYQNIEQRWTELVRRCFSTWITKYERAMYGLLPKDEYARLNVDAYQRADLLTRYQSYKTGIDAGILQRNEARGLEDLEPLPDQISVSGADAETIGALIRAGYEADSVIDAVTTGDLSKLKHTGHLPVTVQASADPPAATSGGQ